MNIEAQNLDSLRKLVRELQDENKKLKEKLKKANIAFSEESVFEEKIEDLSEYDPDQGERMICEKNGITPLVERSRSGRGAHVWIFFKRPIAASLARNFGFLLLDRGQASINLKSFQYYDRMYPCQDGKEDVWDNLMRIKSAHVAEELLELSLGNKED